MVSEQFYCWVAGSFNLVILILTERLVFFRDSVKPMIWEGVTFSDTCKLIYINNYSGPFSVASSVYVATDVH